MKVARGGVVAGSALVLGRLTRRVLVRAGLAAAGAGALAACGGGTAAPPGAAPTGTVSNENADEGKLYEAAKGEGKVVWWTAHYVQSAAEAVRDAFVAKYPGIEVEFIRQTAQVIYQRLTQDLKAGVKEVDVFASTDESHYTSLTKEGVLAKYTPLGVNELPEAFRTIDPAHTYHAGAFGFDLINFNPTKASGLQKWTDLLDSKWKDQITIGHPGFSGYVGNWVVAMWDKYKWDYFMQLAKNNPKIGRSVNDTVTDIVGGERNVGSGPDNYSLEKKAGGESIDVQFPTDDSIMIVSPVGVLSDAVHPNAGKLFTSFYYSKEYSEVMSKTFNYPLRKEVAPPSGKALDSIKWYRNKADRLETGIPEAVDKWRETFGV